MGCAVAAPILPLIQADQRHSMSQIVAVQTEKTRYIPSQDKLPCRMGELFCDVIPMPDQLVR